MKSKIPLTLAALALFGLPACGGGASAAGGKLIPEQATIMGGIDVAGLMKTKLYTDNKAEVEKQREYKEVADAAKACNLDPEKAIASILFGTDGKDGVAAVITGDGIGDEKNLTCVADKAQETNNGKAPFTIVDEGGKKILKMDDGKGQGFIVDGRTIVFASEPWKAAVKDLIDGKGKAATDGPNKDLFARADQSKHIWGAGVIPAEVAGAGKGAGVDAKDASGSLDLSDGLAVKATVTVASAEQAEAAKKKADENMPLLKAGAGMFGLTKAVDSISVTAKGAQISVEAAISNDEIKTLKEKAGGMLGGMMGGGGGGGMDAPPMDAPPATPPADPAAAPAAPAPAH